MTGYRFTRGWWVISHVADDKYPTELISRMWPIVKAALRKHGMRTGWNIRKVMDSEDG